MTESSWILLTVGSLAITLALMLFLYTLWLGLHRRRWWPLLLVTGVWLVAMVSYAVMDSRNYDGSSRSRIQQADS